MKTKILITTLALGATAWLANAQDAEQRPPGAPGQSGQGHGPRMMPPIVSALDANHDGTIDADEIAKASMALKSLDKDGDGKLSMEELRPARPEGAPGGQGGPGQSGSGKRQGQGAAGTDQQRPPREHAQGGSQGGFGQGGPGQGGPGQGGHSQGQRPTPPIISALDANHDGSIDAAELANASTALKSLDKDGDGKLSREELIPARPQGHEAGGRGGEGHPHGGPDGAPQQ